MGGWCSTSCVRVKPELPGQGAPRKSFQPNQDWQTAALPVKKIPIEQDLKKMTDDSFTFTTGSMKMVSRAKTSLTQLNPRPVIFSDVKKISFTYEAMAITIR